MFRVLVAIICVLGICVLDAGFAPAYAEQSSGQTPPVQQPDQSTSGPDRQADSSMPRNGVIHPAPDSSPDTTVNPPNVDPSMTVPPPGTPGGNPAVVPK